MSLRDPVEILGGLLNRRRSDDRELYPMQVVGRLGDGRTQYQRFDGECIETGGLCASYEGQIVERPCRPASTLDGASGLGMVSATRTIGTLNVERLDPPTFDRGDVITVTVIGSGFLPTFDLDWLQYDSTEVNEDITTTAKRFVSSSEVELDIEVSADADLLYDAEGEPIALPISYDNVGSSL